MIPSADLQQPASRRGIAPDLAALAFVLVLAWWRKWEVKDLVWSLWLSSLTIGYLTIVLTIFCPLISQRESNAGAKPLLNAPLPVKLLGGAILLAFFTVHFGMFHFVHSVFLNAFFPVDGMEPKGFPGSATYWTVFTTYWAFAIAAAVAERENLRTAIKKQSMMRPYANVIRMHLLIFFFAGAAMLNLDSFLIYAVVLIAYFFPYRVFRFRAAEPAESPAT